MARWPRQNAGWFIFGCGMCVNCSAGMFSTSIWPYARVKRAAAAIEDAVSVAVCVVIGLCSFVGGSFWNDWLVISSICRVYAGGLGFARSTGK